MIVTYERYGADLVKVLIDGAFAGWLTRSSHRTTGLNPQRYMLWQGHIGSEIRVTTLTKAKAKIAAMVASKETP